ncbi:MAG: TetR/AcrR family transcriptional regulator [Mycobacteriales bacterium]
MKTGEKSALRTVQAQPGREAAAMGEERSMRADARRNRERVLGAAREAFAEEGADVQMDTVAHRAGVGVGTLYRHFPTKHALITEIIRQWLVDRIAIAHQARAIDDPSAALRFVIQQSAKNFYEHAGLRNAFAEVNGATMCEAESAALRESLETVIRRAQGAGVIRANIDVNGFLSLLCGLSASISAGAPWQCSADVLTAGLAPEQTVGQPSGRSRA